MGKLGSRDTFSSREAGQEKGTPEIRVQGRRDKAHPCDSSRGDAEDSRGPGDSGQNSEIFGEFVMFNFQY